MLLLYRPYFIRCISWFCIYIPLCFYFIKTVSTSRMNTSLIYIPLCFYFILDRTFHIRKNIEFTFHYASTLSVTGWNLVFIYRIYIPLCFYFIGISFSNTRPCLHLHSTMLLLYRIDVSNWQAGINHLHSTMLLLYPAHRCHLPGNPHTIYVPLCFYFIQDISAVKTDNPEYLHSTMLLLYR